LVDVQGHSVVFGIDVQGVNDGAMEVEARATQRILRIKKNTEKIKIQIQHVFEE
jgi:hypothetical protein